MSFSSQQLLLQQSYCIGHSGREKSLYKGATKDPE